MSIELKIKSKSLAAEARIIRAEEAKLLNRLDGVPAVFDKESKLDEATRKLRLVRLRFMEGYGAIRRHRMRRRPRRGAANLPCARLSARAALSTYREQETRDGRELTDHDWKGIEAMVLRYGVGEAAERMVRFQDWRETASSPVGASREK